MNKLWIFHSSDELYGSDRVLLQIVEALDRRQWEVCVILPDDLPYQSALSQRLGELEVQVQHRTLAVLRRRYQNLPGLLKLGWQSLISVPALVWQMRHDKVTLVYTNTGVVLSGAIAAKLSGTPHIWGLKEYLPPGKIKNLLARLYSWLSQAITVTSRAVSDNLSAVYPPATSKIKIIYNAVNTKHFQPDANVRQKTRADLGLTDNTLLCAMLGRVAQSKGPEVFIQAAQTIHSRFPDVQFLIVGGAVPGSETYLATLKTQVQTLGLSQTVRFLDFQPDVMPLLNAVDILVMPSLRPEGFGLTLVEAMAVGCPVVASAQGGPLETVVPGETGLLYNEPHDFKALADCLIQLLEKPTLRQQMGQAGRIRVQQLFSSQSEAQAYRQLFANDLNLPK